MKSTKLKAQYRLSLIDEIIEMVENNKIKHPNHLDFGYLDYLSNDLIQYDFTGIYLSTGGWRMLVKEESEGGNILLSEIDDTNTLEKIHELACEKTIGLTFEMKLKRVMMEFEIPAEKAREKVYFIDWITREDEFLKSIFPQFKKDIDQNAEFMGMCEALWNDNSTNIRNENYINLN